MDKCDCWYEQMKQVYTYDRFTGVCDGVYSKPVGVCYGNKEKEECQCMGDRGKCDFYPEVREKAMKVPATIDEAISHFTMGITHDIFSEPVTSYANLAIEALRQMQEKEQNEPPQKG